MPEVKAILGRYLLSESFTEEDIYRNTDLMVLKMEAVRIGVRIRRHYVYKNEDWSKQFTIRYELMSGEKTEFQKILEGWGDYFFYGFADESGEHLEQWFIGDFDVFRKFIKKLIDLQGIKTFEKHYRLISNYSFRDSTFIWFWQNEIPDFVVADSTNWEKVIA